MFGVLRLTGPVQVHVTIIVDADYSDLGALVIKPLQRLGHHIQDEFPSAPWDIDPIRTDLILGQGEDFREERVDNEVVPSFHMETGEHRHQSQPFI
jgi:hypothetical protein